MTDYGLIHGDALRIPLRDASVDAIITSPPYFALRSYQDDGDHYDGQIGSEPTPAEFLAALWAVMDECYRVLKPTGSAFVNLGDKYDSGTAAKRVNPGTVTDGQGQGWNQGTPRYSGGNPKSLMGLPWRFALGLTCPDTYRTDGVAGPQWTLRAELIWSKPNGLPESVTDRVRRSHEQWFHLTRGPKYYAGVDEIREVQDSRGKGRPWSTDVEGTLSGDAVRWGEQTGTQGLKGHRTTDQMNALNPLGKLPGSVWVVPSEPLRVPDHIGVDHFAAFPQEWCRRLILGWTPNGICTACGEGRRPVVYKRPVEEATARRNARTTVWDAQVDGTRTGGRDTDLYPFARHEATITGYACACDVNLAPTRPAVIFDPFVGTGTVPMTARALGRFGVGLDLSHDYLRLARWRIADSRHGAKTINRTNRERQGNLW